MFNHRLIKIASLLLFATTSVLAQMPPGSVTPGAPEPQEDFTWWYLTLFVLFLGLAGAIIWWLNTKKARTDAGQETKKKQQKAGNNEFVSTYVDREMEWLRKNKKPTVNKNKRLPQTSKIFNKKGVEDEELPAEVSKNGSNVLPVFTIQKLELARPYAPLSISNDDALMSAIEQVHDEYEEDEEVRDLSLRILAAFKTRNSAEALSQIAHYDLSSNLRSRAVTTLAEFDHESVFEPILLSCADPSREVRAAAARGLFRLNFDRADAWTRIAETGEVGRMCQAARAAVEADLVGRSFDRLVHQDRKIAYEAFTLVSLLLKAGETKEVFDALEKHRDLNVRKAILHVIKVTREQKALEGLYSLLEKKNLPDEMRKNIDEVIKEIGLVAV